MKEKRKKKQISAGRKNTAQYREGVATKDRKFHSYPTATNTVTNKIQQSVLHLSTEYRPEANKK